jgi:hypothetical protein
MARSVIRTAAFLFTAGRYRLPRMLATRYGRYLDSILRTARSLKTRDKGIGGHCTSSRRKKTQALPLTGSTYGEEPNGPFFCEHCLHTLSFDGFSHDLPEHERRKIVSSFSIWRFFKSYPKCLVVEDSVRESEAGANNGYVRDFSEFSARMKREREYKCDSCKIALMVPSDHRFLHVIYDDEARRSRNSKNVRVLCLGCDADQPGHEQMKSLLEYREFIRRFGHARSARPVPPRFSSAGSQGPTSSQGRTTKRSRSTEALAR